MQTGSWSSLLHSSHEHFMKPGDWGCLEHVIQSVSLWGCCRCDLKGCTGDWKQALWMGHCLGRLYVFCSVCVCFDCPLLGSHSTFSRQNCHISETSDWICIILSCIWGVPHLLPKFNDYLIVLYSSIGFFLEVKSYTEECCFLVCDTLYSGMMLPLIQRNVLPVSCWKIQRLLLKLNFLALQCYVPANGILHCDGYGGLDSQRFCTACSITMCYSVLKINFL